VHCWILLRDVPKWAESRDESRRVQPVKRKLPEDVPHVESVGIVTGVVEVGKDQISTKKPKRPQDSKLAKEEHKTQKLKECAIRAHAKATADMALATHEKSQILQDQSAVLLFTMKDDQLVSEDATEYFKLQRQEELQKLRSCLQVSPSSGTSHATGASDSQVKESQATKSEGCEPARNDDVVTVSDEKTD
jgi:hypothetical protein